MSEMVLVTVPQETVNDESVRIIAWKVPSGSHVEADQQICEVETSKALIDIEAPAAGTVLYSAAPGDEVPVGAALCQILPDSTGGATGVPYASTNGTSAGKNNGTDRLGSGCSPGLHCETAPRAVAGELAPARLSAAAARIAAEYGLNPDSFPPGSLIRQSDVFQRVGRSDPDRSAAVTRIPIASQVEDQQAQTGAVPGVRVDWCELPRRKLVEARLLGGGRQNTVQSQVSCCVSLQRLRAKFDGMGCPEVGFGALIAFELARLLRKFPEFNAVYSHGQVGKYSDVNIGWALDSGKGLMVPVIMQADLKGYREICETMLSQMERYLTAGLSPSDMLGGTFTISDLSSEGITYFSPLISQGQAAILGIGGQRYPDGTENVFLTLAFDHQVADGRRAAQLLRDLGTRLNAHDQSEHIVPISMEEETAHCVLCHRSGDELRALRAILVVSKLPEGMVCSLCLGDLS